LALVVSAVALFAVVTSGGGSDSSSSSATPAATATATATAKAKKTPAKRRPKTYTVQAGDTPSAIAQKTGVDLDALLQANPDADPGALHVGQKLKLP
jgi:LysM repeat protein